MQKLLLQDLIEQNIHLGSESATGFRAVRCASCNDHSERAGFKFEGGTVGYSCFNCARKFRYEELSGKLSRDARKVLLDFGIKEQQIQEVLGSSFFVKAAEPKEVTLESLKPKITLYTPEVELPPKCYPLGSSLCDELQAPIIEYLLSRCIDPLEVNALFSVDPKYFNRVIIPCMREGKVIFWQARTIIDAKPRYLSPGLSKEAVLWGYDNLWKNYDQPLFITEGIFDAAPLSGVALIGSKMNASKLEVLNKCRRRKIVVMDRDENGENLANLALSEGWEISWPGPSARGQILDVNKCVQKYGRAYTIWTLMKNSTTPKGMRGTDGVAIQSRLNMELEQTLARMSRK